MTPENNNCTDEVHDREILVSCLIEAPREAVFHAWTDPAILPTWWGPDGFTNTVDEIDIRPGGHWSFIMHGPDGTAYKNHIQFDEVITPSRITYTHTSGPIYKGIATFDEEGGNKTLVTLQSQFATAELRERVVKEFGALEGAHQMLGRLEAVVTRPAKNT